MPVMGTIVGGPVLPPDHPYIAELDLERERWAEIVDLCRSIDDRQRGLPGYFADGAWSVKDLVAHLGTWMAEAQTRLLRVEAGISVEESIDVDAMNAVFLEAMRDQAWDTCWTQAHSARSMMLTAWARISERSPAADRWVRKAGADHYGEHLPRLRAWVRELRDGSVGSPVA
jgi:hypothetical protein